MRHIHQPPKRLRIRVRCKKRDSRFPGIEQIARIGGAAILALLFVVVGALPGFTQAGKGLTLNEIIIMIKNGLNQERIARTVEERGVGFELDDHALQRLKEAKANETVLLAVKKASAQYAKTLAEEEHLRAEAEVKRKVEAKRIEQEKLRAEAARAAEAAPKPAKPKLSEREPTEREAVERQQAEESRSKSKPPNYSTVRVFFATDRNRSNNPPAKMFGSDRAMLSYGTCEVSIPRDHRMGALEAPSVLRFEFKQDPEVHIVLLNVNVQDKTKYFADIATRIKASSKKSAFIFVHGYRVTFEDAARRTAQMAYDLGFNGAPVFYSWPSQGTLAGYPIDEANNEWTQTNLRQFLDDFTSQTDAENIFLIGHSMGNRALTRAIGQLITEKPTLRNIFTQIILSAPDIDAEVFQRDIAPQIVRATLYASSTDEALTLSKKFHKYARAGDAGAGLVIVQGIDTIDATNVSTDFIGHSYFAESRSVISDIFYLIKDGKSAQERFGLVESNTAAGRYWVFKR